MPDKSLLLRARKAIEGMKEYHPPLSGRSGLRLDFNENTSSCSPRVREKLRGITGEELTKYPERETIERKAAQFFGLDPDQVILTNGVDEGIHLICETYLDPTDEVVISVPTFSMYEIYAQMSAARIVSVQADEDFAFPLEKILAAITPKTKLIPIASPNNPTGAAAAKADLIRILKRAPQAAVLIDEAYFHFFGDTMLTEIARFRNLLVARTFSKAYGLAGLRVGMIAGSVEAMRMLRKACSPYNVNGVALACLEVALGDEAFIADYSAQVKEGRARLERWLAAAGVKFWPSEANFVLTKVGDEHSDFVTAMRQYGILVRDRSSDPGCDGCVRITIGTREQTDRLLSVLSKVLEQIGARGSKVSEVSR